MPTQLCTLKEKQALGPPVTNQQASSIPEHLLFYPCRHLSSLGAEHILPPEWVLESRVGVGSCV